VQTPHDTPYPIEQIDSPATAGANLAAVSLAARPARTELALALLTWFFSVILLLLIPVIVSLPYLLYLYQTGGPLTGDALIANKTFIFFNILGVIPAHIITFAIAWAVVTGFGRRSFWRTIGWDWAPNFRFWKSAGLAIALMIIGVAILSRFGGQPTDMDKIILSSRLNACTTAFLATVTAPLVEEVIYRGVLYSALQRVVGVAGAVLVVMSLFTVVHGPEYWPNFGVLFTILLLSLALTVVRARTNRLLPSYVIHLVFNGVQSFVIVVGPYLPDISRLLQRRASGWIILSYLLSIY